jgi:hypothetical protein
VEVFVKRDDLGWLVTPKISFDSILYVLEGGRTYMQLSSPVTMKFIHALMASPLVRLEVHSHGRASALTFRGGTQLLGDACECLRNAYVIGTAGVLPPLPAGANNDAIDPNLSPGLLIATGSRQVLNGIAITLIAAGAGLALSAAEAYTPAVILGGAGMIVGVVLTIQGHSKIEKAGDRLQALGY